MLTTQRNIDQVLSLVAGMPLADQEWLIELLERRYHETRRMEIAANAQESLREHLQGITKTGTVDELLADLDDESDLG